MVKRLWLTILLAVVFWGIGHIYLGLVKRGITILVIGIVTFFVALGFVPFPYGGLIMIGYWAWQIWDVHRRYKKLDPVQPQNTLQDKYQFHSLNRLTKTAIILALMSLSAIGMLFLETIIWKNYYPMANSDQVFTISSNYIILNIYGTLIWVAIVGNIGFEVIFLWWVYRANKNIHSFGAIRVFSPRMSVIWYFVPVINLWKSYQIVKQIWKASNTTVLLAHGDEWKHQNIPLNLIKIWWISEIMLVIVGVFILGFADFKGSAYLIQSYTESSYPDILMILSAVKIGVSPLLLLFRISGIKLIRQVSKWQDIKVKDHEINMKKGSEI